MKCHFCGKDIGENEECPVVVSVQAYRVGGPGYYDPSQLPEFADRLLNKPMPRLDVCPTCTGVYFTFRGHPDQVHAQ